MTHNMGLRGTSHNSSSSCISRFATQSTIASTVAPSIRLKSLVYLLATLYMAPHAQCLCRCTVLRHCRPLTPCCRPSSCHPLVFQVVDGTLVKIYAWYDNEYGYSCRLVDLAHYVATKKGGSVSN